MFETNNTRRNHANSKNHTSGLRSHDINRPPLLLTLDRSKLVPIYELKINKKKKGTGAKKTIIQATPRNSESRLHTTNASIPDEASSFLPSVSTSKHNASTHIQNEHRLHTTNASIPDEASSFLPSVSTSKHNASTHIQNEHRLHTTNASIPDEASSFLPSVSTDRHNASTHIQNEHRLHTTNASIPDAASSFLPSVSTSKHNASTHIQNEHRLHTTNASIPDAASSFLPSVSTGRHNASTHIQNEHRLHTTNASIPDEASSFLPSVSTDRHNASTHIQNEHRLHTTNASIPDAASSFLPSVSTGRHNASTHIQNEHRPHSIFSDNNTTGSNIPGYTSIRVGVNSDKTIPPILTEHNEVPKVQLTKNKNSRKSIVPINPHAAAVMIDNVPNLLFEISNREYGIEESPIQCDKIEKIILNSLICKNTNSFFLNTRVNSLFYSHIQIFEEIIKCKIHIATLLKHVKDINTNNPENISIQQRQIIVDILFYYSIYVKMIVLFILLKSKDHSKFSDIDTAINDLMQSNFIQKIGEFYTANYAVFNYSIKEDNNSYEYNHGMTWVINDLAITLKEKLQFASIPKFAEASSFESPLHYSNKSKNHSLRRLVPCDSTTKKTKFQKSTTYDNKDIYSNHQAPYTVADKTSNKKRSIKIIKAVIIIADILATIISIIAIYVCETHKAFKTTSTLIVAVCAISIILSIPLFITWKLDLIYSTIQEFYETQTQKIMQYNPRLNEENVDTQYHNERQKTNYVRAYEALEKSDNKEEGNAIEQLEDFDPSTSYSIS